MIEVREAPIPVKFWWFRDSPRLGWKDWGVDGWLERESVAGCLAGNPLYVELSNGQTVIVRAKK